MASAGKPSAAASEVAIEAVSRRFVGAASAVSGAPSCSTLIVAVRPTRVGCATSSCAPSSRSRRERWVTLRDGMASAEATDGEDYNDGEAEEEEGRLAAAEIS